MYQLSNAIPLLKECKSILNQDIKRLKKIVGKSPKGALIIQENSNRNPKYYWQQNENGQQHRTYLSKNKKLRTIQKLSDKKYARTALKAIEKTLKCIGVFLKSCPEPSELGFDLADRLAEKHYITTSATSLSRQEYIRQWKESFNDFLCFHDEHKIHADELGNLFRSKSEAMIARELRAAGIEFVYDARKDLSDGEFVYPDFTFLHPITLEEMYWEHFGLIDKPKYANRFMEKRAEFEAAGLKEEKNLFFTFETEQHPLTQEQICKTISRIINLY